jgi:NTE family protein
MAMAGSGSAPIKPPPLADLPPLEVLTPACRAAIADELAWAALAGGQILFQEGEPADSLYLLTTGLLGVIAPTADRGQVLVAEIRAGETVGEMSLITGEVHSATVVALRHSEFYRMPKAVFDRLVAEEPKFLAWLNRLVVQRLYRTTRRTGIGARAAVALVPLDDGVPIEAVVSSLLGALKQQGLKAFRFEPDAIEQPVEWFDELESAHQVVLYQADPVRAGTSAWCRFCLRQTDRVVLIGNAGCPVPDPLPGIETGKSGGRAAPDLVILESLERGRTGTVPEDAPRFGTVHHLRLHAPGDVARLARHLAGRAVGLVLSGGAARGFAHIGAIRAWREAGLPIDRIGGASMGAVIAAGVAAGWDDRELRDRIHQAFVETNPLNDYTVPWIALFRGETVNRLLRQHFNQTVIAALWRPFFAVSTNLTRGGLLVHRHGVLWQALRASIAIPGVLPPLSVNGEILVDGGVLDNFPVDVMAGIGSGPIVGVDVGAAPALTPGSEAASGRRGLIDFFRPDPGRLPGIVSVLSRVGTVTSTLQTALARAQLSLLIQPPIADVALLEWHAFERAVEAGYRAMATALEAADLGALHIDASV